jgi:hypothetical protein
MASPSLQRRPTTSSVCIFIRRVHTSFAAPPMAVDALLAGPRSPRKLFRRMSAQAVGLEASVLCRRSHWVPKSSRSTCANCRRAFKLFAGKHHCRLCGEVVCKSCSGKRILFQKKGVRACDDCIDVNLQSMAASASTSASASASASASGSRRKSLPDARFQGRASSRTLLSTGRHSLPYAPGILTSSGSSSGSGDDLFVRARSSSASKTRATRRSRKDVDAAGGLALLEWRSIVKWSGSPGHLPSVVFVVCLAVLSSLLAAAARQ